jgi:crotonobetaine/carnitine-CoA ligase
MPLYHTNAQVYSVLAAIWVGARIVLLPRFSASRFWPISLKHRCTWTSIVPFCVAALAERPRPDSHSYRYWANAYCDPPTDALLGVKTIGWWGMTETVTHGIVGSLRLPNAPYAMGRAAPEYEIRVEDQDGAVVRPGEIGELFIRGRSGISMFAEYADDPDATAAAYRPDGFFATGDRVRRGEDGILYFSDRSKDMLKVGGENVAASELERVMLMVPGVHEVAVVGRSHPMLDEVPVAFVIPAEGAGPMLADDIAAACRRQLAPFKQPHEVRLVASLPRATLEKVAKSALRDLLRQEHETKSSPICTLGDK